MITLLTGGNGTGKTNLVMKYIVEAIQEGRKVYVDGIPELLLQVKKCGDVTTWQEGTWLGIETYDPLGPDPDSNWTDNGNGTPDKGALIVLDECQRHYRPRHASRAVPPHVSALEVHRHQGLDFLLITQSTKFLDSAVRELVGKHIHLARTAFKIQKYEWPEIGDPKSPASKQIASRSTHKPIKKYYGFYKSASVHTKLKQSLPNAVIILPFALALAGFFAWTAYSNVMGEPEVFSSAVASPAIIDASGSAGAQPQANPNRDYQAEVNSLDQVNDDKPIISGCGSYWKKNRFYCDCRDSDFQKLNLDIVQCMSFLGLDGLPENDTPGDG